MQAIDGEYNHQSFDCNAFDSIGVLSTWCPGKRHLQALEESIIGDNLYRDLQSSPSTQAASNIYC
jgi:hypothetical protein